MIGGLGSAVAEALVENCPVPMERIGAKDRFGEVGSFDYLKGAFRMGAADIAEAVRSVLARKKA